MADDNLPKPEDWHELAQRIQVETDPDKMIELVRELIARFDEEKLRKSLLVDRKMQGGRTSRPRGGGPCSVFHLH
jgi:hypothetical protein